MAYVENYPTATFTDICIVFLSHSHSIYKRACWNSYIFLLHNFSCIKIAVVVICSHLQECVFLGAKGYIVSRCSLWISHLSFCDLPFVMFILIQEIFFLRKALQSLLVSWRSAQWQSHFLNDVNGSIPLFPYLLTTCVKFSIRGLNIMLIISYEFSWKSMEW
jgi:hypothetical protein